MQPGINQGTWHARKCFGSPKNLVYFPHYTLTFRDFFCKGDPHCELRSHSLSARYPSIWAIYCISTFRHSFGNHRLPLPLEFDQSWSILFDTENLSNQKIVQINAFELNFNLQYQPTLYIACFSCNRKSLLQISDRSLQREQMHGVLLCKNSYS